MYLECRTLLKDAQTRHCCGLHFEGTFIYERAGGEGMSYDWSLVNWICSHMGGTVLLCSMSTFCSTTICGATKRIVCINCSDFLQKNVPKKKVNVFKCYYCVVYKRSHCSFYKKNYSCLHLIFTASPLIGWPLSEYAQCDALLAVLLAQPRHTFVFLWKVVLKHLVFTFGDTTERILHTATMCCVHPIGLARWTDVYMLCRRTFRWL